jgi:pyruvate ferredoxin oxidoreductase gamma subunit
MYRIRFHGRGGQGMKTASRILGSALFLEGYRVQDAPRYGAERRGAPIFAYVRAAHDEILERGIITRPDLVLVADDSLVSIPAAGVTQGLRDHAMLVLVSRESAATWSDRLNLSCKVVVLPPADTIDDPLKFSYPGATLAGAAARLLGIVSRASLVQAIRDELEAIAPAVRQENEALALLAYDELADMEAGVIEGESVPVSGSVTPQWVDELFEEASVAAPVIHGGLTSVEVHTGLWRTMRPVIELERCNRCWWVCSTFCPDSAISINKEGYPEVDYEHCKGCMICVAKCPPHAIEAVSERRAQEQEA